MSARRPEAAIERVLLALEATACTRCFFEPFVELAARLDAELEALIIEDPNLLRSSELPFTRQVSALTAREERLEIPSLERELRGLARRAERLLADAAEGRRLRWSLRVVRGEPSREMSSAARGSELVAIPAERRVSLFRRDEPVLVLHDGSFAGDQAVAAAGRLARTAGHEVQVVVAAKDPRPVVARLEAQASAAARDLHLLTLPHTAPAELLPLLANLPGSPLVCDADAPVLAGEDLATLARRLSRPLLLIRARRAGA